jgi:hypothetical protein
MGRVGRVPEGGLSRSAVERATDYVGDNLAGVGQVAAENGFRVMAYDVPAAGQSAGPSEPSTRSENGMTITRKPFCISLRGEDVDEATRYWGSFPTARP